MIPGTSWYQDAREAVQRNYPEDWKLFCALLAATSARASVKANVTLARKAYNQIKDTGTVKRELFCYTHYKGILRVIEKGLPSGRKCNALYQNLIGNETQVPVDIWMLRYAGINKKSPSKRDYDYIEDRVREEAELMGVTVAQRQAQIWCKIRGSSLGYSEALQQERLL